MKGKIPVQEDRKLKIGFLSFYPHLGGSAIAAYRTAVHLAEKGHEPHLFIYNGPIDGVEELSLNRKGIKVHRVLELDYNCLTRQPYEWTTANKICEVYSEGGLDLLHAHYAIPHALIARIAKEEIHRRGGKLPVIVTGHGSDVHTNGNKSEVNKILNYALDGADAITYVSRGLQTISERELGVTTPGSHITNFVDTNVFYPEDTKLRADLGIKQQDFVVGHVSNFADIKHVDHFLQVAKRLKSRGMLDSVYFVMGGGGETRDHFEHCLHTEGLLDHFRFLGRLNPNELRAAYSSMDVFALTSEKEGCPLTCLESLACGTPLIGTNVEGIREIVNPEYGWLFDFKDYEGFYSRLASLMESREAIRSAGERGRSFVKNHHSVEVVIGKYLDLYRRILTS
ncbi:MAG: glycosyltransferase [archaeon]